MTTAHHNYRIAGVSRCSHGTIFSYSAQTTDVGYAIDLAIPYFLWRSTDALPCPSKPLFLEIHDELTGERRFMGAAS